MPPLIPLPTRDSNPTTRDNPKIKKLMEHSSNSAMQYAMISFESRKTNSPFLKELIGAQDLPKEKREDRQQDRRIYYATSMYEFAWSQTLPGAGISILADWGRIHPRWKLW
ncbi:hypothetical protein M8J76_014731 [Diaphorina citri]|nr:hypothetical protein M8J76_014731 [Diaphorina citri]